MANNRVLLVDDDLDILEINKDYLIKNNFEVSTATTMTEAIERTQLQHYDCIVLDVMLPDGKAFDKVGILRQFSKAPIIFLTALEDLDDRIAGFQVGADDYLTKPYALEELSLRIKAHIRRSMVSEGFLLEFEPLKINIKTRQVMINDTVLKLTNREFDILRLLSETPNVIVPFKRIFKHVWGENEECDNHLIMVNVSYLRKKMERVDPSITFIKTEWGLGYSFAYPPIKNSMLTDDD